MPEVVVVVCLIDTSLLKCRTDILNTSIVISLAYTLSLLQPFKKMFIHKVSIYMWLFLNKIKSNSSGIPVADQP